MQNLTVSCGLILWVDSFFETWNYIYSYKPHHIFVGTLNPTHESIGEGPWRVVTFLWITSISWVHYGLHGPRLYPSLRSWVATVQRWRTKMSHGERVKAAEVGEQVMGKGQKGWRKVGWWWLRVASWFRSTGFSTWATSCWVGEWSPTQLYSDIFHAASCSPWGSSKAALHATGSVACPGSWTFLAGSFWDVNRSFNNVFLL